MTGDLIERLRASDTLSRGENYEPWVIPASELRLEAAKEIEALSASLAEARRLLKPFADEAATYEDAAIEDEQRVHSCTDLLIGDLRAAARFLAQEPSE